MSILLSAADAHIGCGQTLWDQLHLDDPAETTNFSTAWIDTLDAAAQQLEQQLGELAWQRRAATPQAVLTDVELLLQNKARVDEALRQVLEHRKRLAAIEDSAQRHAAARHYLRAASVLVDLSGRLRYTLRDAISRASVTLDPQLDQFQRLLQLLAQYRSQVGASTMSYVLFNPEPGSGLVPYPDEVKFAALALIEAAGDHRLVDDLAACLRQPDVAPGVALEVATVIRQLGLPQDPLPAHGTDDEQPAIGAGELINVLKRLDIGALDGAQQAKRDELLAWLAQRQSKGITSASLALGTMRIEPGDWLLMRNPSPYNRFTDLGEGLFTHVGLVAEHFDEFGRRHIVIVDLPERGTHIPATNVETYLRRTLHFVFLRDHQAQQAREMAAAAASLIGNPCLFDLTFRTDRVAALRGKPLDGQRIHTYCAGLLLLCAQTTGLPREAYFPIAEGSPSERCQSNLAVLGMSIGKDFISPTGPLFSPRMELVGQCEPMYDPGREVKEATYDYFADAMAHESLHPSPNLKQALVQRIAQLSTSQEWLRQMLARANNVSEELDLAAAARAAATVETLDEIANGCLEQFEMARAAIMAGPDNVLQQLELTPAERQDTIALRSRHADLLDRWLRNELTPRQLRIALVQYYSKLGVRQLRERFFSKPSSESESASIAEARE